MSKKDFFSKLNIKNYNNGVELILEKKDFLSTTKNLILSMFYKIEVAYNDYNIVKPYAVTKSEYIEYLMKILDKECEEIEILTPSETNLKELNPYIHSSIEGKLIAYSNITSLLYSLIDINKKYFHISNSYLLIKEAFKQFLNSAYCIDNIEVIRDFDGWSWNIDLKSETAIKYNLIYQNLQILIGNKLFRDWKNDSGVIIDYIYKIIFELEEQYGEEHAKRMYILICSAILSIYIDNNEKRQIVEKELEETKNKIEIMKDKTSFLQNVSNMKKEYVKQIKAIDTMINTPKLIEREFVVRNRKLDDDHKIFSISELVQMLNSDRRDLIEKIQECNESIDPRIYARQVERLSDNITIAESIQNNKGVFVEVQEEFLKLIKLKAEKIHTKDDICKFITIIRYYSNLQITEGMEIKEILPKEIFEIQNILFKKACEFKIIGIINKDIYFNSEILKTILDTKVVDLTEIEIKLSVVVADELEIEIYEGEILESKKTVKIPEGKTDFNVKIDKKFKLYN